MSKITKDTLALALIIALTTIVTRQWLVPGLPRTHDAETHIARAAVFSKSIMEGNILPRWAGSLNWRYGTPSIMFLYPGVPYAAALIHLATSMQFIDIFKLFMVVGYAGSGLVWFKWMRTIKFSPVSAFVSSLFYLLAPYRLVNIFVRGAMAEHLGFFFFPLIMLTGTSLIITRKRRYLIGLALSVAGLVLTHNLSVLLYLPIIMVYPFLMNLTKKTGIRYFGGIILGFVLTAFFWIPALMESKYTLSSWMFSAKDWYADNFLFPVQLLWSPWGYGWSEPGPNDGMSFQIGIAQILILLIGLAMLGFRKYFRTNNTKLLVFGFIWVFLGIFITLPVSAWAWKIVPLMPKFQFPWRFLSYIVVGSALAVAPITETIKKNTLLIILIIILPIVFTINYWKISGPSDLTEKFLTKDYVGTSDTGETSPIWAIRFQEQFPKSPVEVVSSDGKVEISNLVKYNQRHEFEVSVTARSQMADNTLYFPGWTVYVDGNKVPITYQDINWRGVITFPVESGKHRVVVVFEETLLRKIADAASIIGLGILAWLVSKS